MDNANQSGRTGNLVALQVSPLEMQGSFGPSKADPAGRLDLHTLATTAATHGHLDIVRHLCKNWDVAANAVQAEEELHNLRQTVAGSKKGTDAPLVQAIQNGHEDIALFLIALPNHDLDLNRRMTFHNCTALHWATEQGMVKVVKELVEKHGMDFAAPDGRDMTPLCLASYSEHADMLAFILELYHEHGRLLDVKPCSVAYYYRSMPTSALHNIIRECHF